MSAALKAGDRIKDNDPRMPNRVLVVQSVDVRFAVALSPVGRLVRIERTRIYGDSKPRRTGFSVVVVA